MLCWTDLYGDVNRISPEAPVPVVNITREENRLGGASNVALNVKTLGGKVTLLSVLGEDDSANSLRKLLSNQDIKSELLQDACMETTIKLRVISRSQQMLRIDVENKPDHHILNSMVQRFDELLPHHDGVLFSDYGKGGLSLISTMIDLACAAGKPVFVDPKGSDWSRYAGATIITPNCSELANVAGSWSDESELSDKASPPSRAWFSSFTSHSI